MSSNMSGGFLIGTAPTSLKLETRKKNQIENTLSSLPVDGGLLLQVENWKKTYPNAIHREAGPCHTFNCHGLTFASRRCWVDDRGVSQVMSDDEYSEVAGEISPGDIVLYIDNGNVTHSGVVVWISPPINGIRQPPHILSKWGSCHEVVHKPYESPYSENASYKFYRIKT